MNLLKVFSFKGRITRLEFNISIAIVILLLLAGVFFYPYFDDSNHYLSISMILLSILIIVLQGYKRYHDLGQKGWRIFISLDYTLFIKEGDEGENEHGPDPRMSNVI